MNAICKTLKPRILLKACKMYHSSTASRISFSLIFTLLLLICLCSAFLCLFFIIIFVHVLCISESFLADSHFSFLPLKSVQFHLSPLTLFHPSLIYSLSLSHPPHPVYLFFSSSSRFFSFFLSLVLSILRIWRNLWMELVCGTVYFIICN